MWARAGEGPTLSSYAPILAVGIFAAWFFFPRIEKKVRGLLGEQRYEMLCHFTVVCVKYICALWALVGHLAALVWAAVLRARVSGDAGTHAAGTSSGAPTPIPTADDGEDELTQVENLESADGAATRCSHTTVDNDGDIIE